MISLRTYPPEILSYGYKKFPPSNSLSLVALSNDIFTFILLSGAGEGGEQRGLDGDQLRQHPRLAAAAEHPAQAEVQHHRLVPSVVLCLGETLLNLIMLCSFVQL